MKSYIVGLKPGSDILVRGEKVAIDFPHYVTVQAETKQDAIVQATPLLKRKMTQHFKGNVSEPYLSFNRVTFDDIVLITSELDIPE